MAQLHKHTRATHTIAPVCSYVHSKNSPKEGFARGSKVSRDGFMPSHEHIVVNYTDQHKYIQTHIYIYTYTRTHKHRGKEKRIVLTEFDDASSLFSLKY